MTRVTRLSARVRRSREPSSLLERRVARVLHAIAIAREPVVWLRAGAGCGKSSLLEAARTEARFSAWHLLDDPGVDGLEAALAECCLESAAPERLLIASRPGAPIAPVLLRHQMYGRVAVYDESQLYVAPIDGTAADTDVLAATGGWPMLVAAHVRGNSEAIRALLPTFLQREFLPELEEGLVAAAIASLSGPISPAAFHGLGDGQEPRHPLFELGESGWTLSSSWVRAALVALRRGAAALPAPVRARLSAYYSGLVAPDRHVIELAAIGEWGEALDAFKNAGGAFFGLRHGYPALEAALAAFPAAWEERVEELYLARLWLLIKLGKSREALLKLDARHPGLPVDLRRMRLTHRAEAILMRIDMALDLDEMPPVEAIASWGRLQDLLPEGDGIARGLLYNSMAIGYLQADALLEAKRMAEESLVAYRAAGSPYLVHCMYVHLCDVAIRESRLDDASELLRQAEAALNESGQAFNSEHAILYAFQSRIALERGRIDEDSDAVERTLRELAEGDSWPDLILRSSVHFVLTGYWKRGLRFALQRLDQCALTLSRRHGYVAHRQLALLRIRVMQVARHHAEADSLLEEYDLAPASAAGAALAVEEGLVRLRQAVVCRRSRSVIGRLTDALSGFPQMQPRHRITASLLQAAACEYEGRSAMARRHLRLALRDAAAHGLVAVLLEDGEFLERSLPRFVASPGPGNAPLAQLAAKILRPLNNLPALPMNSKALAGVSRQEHRVLSYVADGYTNKQIGRALNLSESTVKFHLRSLFKKLKVTSRGGLADAARARGIAT